jgi:predicted ATPase
LPTVGSDSVDRDPTLGAQRTLGRALSLSWRRRTRRGFFLRAETHAELARVESEFAGRSDYARALARKPFARSIAELERRYGVDLDANSH